MLKTDFKYTGSNPASQKMVDTVNSIGEMLKNIKFDLGATRGSDNLVKTQLNEKGIVFDFKSVDLGSSGGGGTPPVTGKSEYMVLQLIDVAGTLTPTWDWVRLADYTP